LAGYLRVVSQVRKARAREVDDHSSRGVAARPLLSLKPGHVEGADQEVRAWRLEPLIAEADAPQRAGAIAVAI
jgi:hypothetical protein